jgi:flagellin
MALTINTNISSIIAQRNLNSATASLNTTIERMTTGYKINSASDNAAGYSIASLWATQLSSLDVAADNAAMGSDMLSTAEEIYSLLQEHLQRVRDLTEQAANGTYGSTSKLAIQSEITARLDEFNRIAANAEFNGVKLLAGKDVNGGVSEDINLQVGLYGDSNSVIILSKDLFQETNVKALLNMDVADVAEQGAGLSSTKKASELLSTLDTALTSLSSRVTSIGAAQNKVTSATSAIEVQSQNLTSSLSTLRDADIAEESSTYIQAQILQQAAATLLSTANQLPSIALNLI